jgi:hypothetical protein
MGLGRAKVKSLLQGSSMAIGTQIEYARLSDLYLDPKNPRLGREMIQRDLTQRQVLEAMSDWTLEELAVSFLESGTFWVQEALLVTREDLNGRERLVVIEGNRRLAALMYLRNAFEGSPASKKWQEIARIARPSATLFTKIPYILVDSRKEIEAFLGFRHVTGIKEWRPAEKAQYIAKLIDTRDMGYEEVMRKIGSKTSTVRQNYISYRLLLEIEDVAGIPRENFEDRFSVMYLSLRTEGVQKYLQIDIKADPDEAKKPVPKSHLKALANFALWLFGDDKRPALFSDSRQVDNFGRILESKEAVEYLERTTKPSFDVAYRMAGADEPEIVRLVEEAADNIELALTRAHLHKKSKKLRKAVVRLRADAQQLAGIFPQKQGEDED